MVRKKEQQIVDPLDHPVNEPMNDLADALPATVGSQLRSAREEKGLTLRTLRRRPDPPAPPGKP